MKNGSQILYHFDKEFKGICLCQYTIQKPTELVFEMQI